MIQAEALLEEATQLVDDELLTYKEKLNNMASLIRRKKKLPEPKNEATIFLGKVYVPGSYRLFLTQKTTIQSAHGAMELQIILTKLGDG